MRVVRGKRNLQNVHNAIPFYFLKFLSKRIGKNMQYFVILSNLDLKKKKHSRSDTMHMKEGRRSKQLPEVGRSRKSGDIVARAEEPQSSRQA